MLLWNSISDLRLCDAACQLSASELGELNERPYNRIALGHNDCASRRPQDRQLALGPRVVHKIDCDDEFRSSSDRRTVVRSKPRHSCRQL